MVKITAGLTDYGEAKKKGNIFGSLCIFVISTVGPTEPILINEMSIDS